VSKDSGKVTQKMSVTEFDSGRAVADFLRREFPCNGAKQLASLLGDVNVRTVEGWFAGRGPSRKHLDRLIAVFGLGFIKSVWGAVIDEPLDNFEAMERLNVFEREFDALRRALVEAEANKAQGQLPLE
jgi:hypothetical protein